MTRDEILKMPVGREMDALIFAKVFGKMAFRVADGDNWIFTDEREYLDAGDAYYLNEHQVAVRLPCYSTDIAAAWEVVEKFNNNCMLNNVHRIWDCYFPDNVKGSGVTASLAICRAALLAVMPL